MVKTYESAKSWVENAPIAPKTWEKPTQPMTLQKQPPIPREMNPTTKNVGWKHTQEVLDAWESSREGKMVRKTWKTPKHGRMAYVFGFLLAQGVKMHSPKTDGFYNSNLGFHTLPIPCNNQLNQLLAVINDWVKKTRKVVGSLMGSPFNIWIFPIGSKVWIPPPPPTYT